MAVITTLLEEAADQGTYIVNVSFEDEDGQAITPKTLSWTLMDWDGAIINGRDGVSIPSPTSSEDILLTGDDLDFGDGDRRRLVIDATYDSSLGSDLPIRAEARFKVEDVKEQEV